jgi:hypothetical protein
VVKLRVTDYGRRNVTRLTFLPCWLRGMRPKYCLGFGNTAGIELVEYVVWAFYPKSDTWSVYPRCAVV